MIASQDRPVRVAMVGLGWWGRKMVAVLEGARAHLDVVCAVEPVPGAEDFCAEHRLKLLGEIMPTPWRAPTSKPSSWRRRIRCTKQQIEEAVAAGKHVFCEKPLAMTKAGAEKAVALCREAGLVLGMGHERRFEPPIAGMLAAAADGRLGRILQIEANFSHDKFLGLDPSNWRLNAEPGAGGGHDRDRHPSDRPVGEAARAGARCPRRLREPGIEDPAGRHDERAYPLPWRRHGLCLGDARHALRLALCRVRHQGLDRGPRQGPCRGAGRLGRHQRLDRHTDRSGRGRPGRTGARQSGGLRRGGARPPGLSDHRRGHDQQHRHARKPSSSRRRPEWSSRSAERHGRYRNASAGL